MKHLTFLLLLTALVFTACKKDDNQKQASSAPKIVSITADKTELLVGGEDPAIITCNAEGDELEYLWEVDLGDIFPLNEEGSMVQFTGSECCIGKKHIKCTVSNSLGSDTDTLTLLIKLP